MMFTRLVTGVEVLADDAKFLDVIKGAADTTERANPAGCFRIGIANESGQVYRTLSGDDLQEFNDTHNALIDAGMFDHFKVGEGSVDGFDAIVQRSDDCAHRSSKDRAGAQASANGRAQRVG
jgi:hypothetical protein